MWHICQGNTRKSTFLFLGFAKQIYYLTTRASTISIAVHHRHKNRWGFKLMDSDRDLCLTEHRVFRSLASLSSVLTVLPHEKSEKSLRFKNLRFFQICRIFQKPWQSNPKVFRCRGDSTFFLLPYFSLFVCKSTTNLRLFFAFYL